MIDDSYNPDADPEEVDQETLRPIFAPGRTRKSIFDRTQKAFESRFPIEDDDLRLEVTNVHYDEKRSKDYGIADTKAAIMGSKKLSRPLMGDVRLIDRKTREVLDERPGHLLANVPYLTDRGTFIMKGTEYVTVNQSRLRPGIYTRIQDNGELEAHVNTRSGTGQQMRVFMKPDTGIYRIKVGGSKIKMYPILKALGASDEEMGEAWGPEILKANQGASDRRAFTKFYDKLVGNRGKRLLESVRKTARYLKGGEHQKEIPAEGEVVQPAPSPVDTLLEARDRSNAGDHKFKHNAVRKLMDEAPGEWEIDQDDGRGIVGVTHKPTGFRLHVPRNVVAPGVAKSASSMIISVEINQGETQGELPVDGKPEFMTFDRLAKLRERRDPEGIEDDTPGGRKRRELEEAYAQVQEPKSKEQADAGNYRHGHVTLHGLPVTLECAPGTTRRGYDSNGETTWETVMKDGYGYVKRTMSEADGDHVDVFVGPHVESEAVFVVDQQRKSGLFDEHKVVLCARNEKEAREIYLRNYEKGWTGLSGITALTIPQFRWWVKHGDTSIPISETRSFKTASYDSWIGVDLDGTLAHGGGDFDPEVNRKTAEDFSHLIRNSGDRTIVGQPIVKYLPSVSPRFDGKSVELRTHGGDYSNLIPSEDGRSGGWNVVAPAFREPEWIDEGSKHVAPSPLYDKVREIGEGAKTVISYACNPDSGDCGMGPEFYERMVPSAERVIMTPKGHLGSPLAGLSTSLTPLVDMLDGSDEPYSKPHLYEKVDGSWVDRGAQEGALERAWDTTGGKALMIGGALAGAGALGLGIWSIVKKIREEKGEDKTASSDAYEVTFYPIGEGKTAADLIIDPFEAAIEADHMSHEFDVEALAAQVKTAMAEEDPDDLSEEERVDLVRHQLERMELDPEVSYRNLGKAYTNMGVGALLDTSRKLLAVNRGKAEPDDRDSMVNKTFHSVDDFMEERVAKDAGSLGHKLFWQAKYKRGLGPLRPGHFSPQLEGLIISNSLSQAISGINPVEFLDIAQKVTQVGEGGVGSMDAIPMSARDVHPTQLGVVDPIRTAESRAVGIDQRFASAARKGPNNQVYFPVRRRKDGATVYRTPSQLYGKTISFPRGLDAQNYLDPPAAEAIVGDGIERPIRPAPAMQLPVS